MEHLKSLNEFLGNNDQLIDHLIKTISKIKEKPNTRKLDKDEILNAAQYHDVDYNKYNLVPLIDIFDNNFICFDYIKNKYCIFNIVDEVKFNYNNNIKNIY